MSQTLHIIGWGCPFVSTPPYGMCCGQCFSRSCLQALYSHAKNYFKHRSRSHRHRNFTLHRTETIFSSWTCKSDV